MLHLSHIPNKINAIKLLNFTQIRLNKIEHSVSVYQFFSSSLSVVSFNGICVGKIYILLLFW